MKETEALIKETIRLDVVDKQLDFNIKDNYAAQRKVITANYDEFTSHVKNVEAKHQDVLKKLEKHSDTLGSHKTTLDELRRTLQSAIDNGTRTAARLEKTKENLQDEITRTRDEIYVKIDFNDRFCIEQFDLIKSHSSKDRNTF
jgi:ABC-type transporter Mla subunit MlaD